MYTDPSGYSWFGDHGITIIAIVVAVAVTVVTYGAASPAIAAVCGAGSIEAAVTAGALSGMVGGFAGGFVGAALNGGDFYQSLGAGMYGAFSGAVSSGITAGILGGISAGLDNLYICRFNSVNGPGTFLRTYSSAFGRFSILESLPNINAFVNSSSWTPLLSQIPSYTKSFIEIGQLTSNARVAAGQGSSGGDQSGYNIDKAVNYLNDHALDKSSGRCAYYVRQALEAGGINTNPHPVSAKNYGSYLSNWGFSTVSPSNYTPAKGDIGVIQPYPGGGPHGHIQMYNGNIWISDFKAEIRFLARRWLSNESTRFSNFPLGF